MTAQADVDVWTMSDLCTPWCVHVIATLDIARHIAEGVTRIEDLAAACAADTDALDRVLRHLVGRGLFEQPAPGVFALNAPARALLDPAVRIGLDLTGIGGRMAHSWGTLLAAVRSGRPAYHEVFGRPFWDDLHADSDVAASFDALIGPAGHGTPDPQVLLRDDWAGVRMVVDVGGGTGSLLAGILRHHPDVRGMLVDFPSTVARAVEIFEAAGVADRVTLCGQSFFDPLPADGDLYLLKNVLADWADDEARALLRCCAQAVTPDGRVVILGGVATEEDAPASPELLMLVLVGGKARSQAEFRQLAASAGLRVSAAARQPSGRFVVECRPTGADNLAP